MHLTDSDDRLSFQEWKKEKKRRHPQFLYWSLVMDLELSVLTFVRSLRTSNFHLYVQTLEELLPWFFLLDHYHYARWLSVHLRDMKELPTTAPEIAQAFAAGKFTVQKTDNVFSSIALDQAHEQMNKMVKGEGGAVGLTENAAALEKWMTAGPEMARLVDEFERALQLTNNNDQRHHEQTAAHQKRYKEDLGSLKRKLSYLGNPFADESEELLCLSTKVVASTEVVNTVVHAKEMGKAQYLEFVHERLMQRSKPLSDPIKLNRVALFRNQNKSTQRTKDLKLKTAKTNCGLFARLYVGCQARGGDPDEFFQRENQSFPPSVSDSGDLRHGNKSDLLECFERTHDPVLTEPQVSAVLIDGATLVHTLKPRQAQTFQEYSDSVFVPYVLMCLSTADRVDIVWDCYRDNSLKSSVRKKRGSGIRRRVKGDVALPRNWPEFLRNSQNKEELFHFLSENLKLIKEDGKLVIATQGADFVTSGNICEEQRARLSPCSHEEADTRLIVHCSDLARMSHTDIMIRTSDTDVVVLATAHYHSLQLEKLWIAFGAGSHFRLLPIHDYASTLGPYKAAASLMFHSFTGCDTVSFFFGVGKKTCWEVWMSDPEFTQLFLRMLASPEKFQDDFNQIERFVSLMYDKTTVHDKVNDARKHLFTKRGRALETIPPTQAALLEHTKRAILQALIWKEALIPQPEIPDPAMWGWEQVDGTYSPVWTSLPDASKICSELVKCSCKKGCRGRCSCTTAGVSCTALCFCDGKCQRD